MYMLYWSRLYVIIGIKALKTAMCLLGGVS